VIIDKQKAEEALKNGHLYYPCASDMNAISLRRNYLECLEPTAWVTNDVIAFYMLYLQRGDEPT
jgi:Ulp1 family protease